MRFSYAYKTSDGARHEGRIEAASRDAAFAALRAQGIRPIKVVAEDGSKANGERRGVRRRVVAAAVLLSVALASFATFWLSRPKPVAFYRADGTTGVCAAGMPARAMTRRQVHGDQERMLQLLAESGTNVFRHASERFLAEYALPGRVVERTGGDVPAEDFVRALESPVETFEGEMPEIAELKGIVAGMKEELRMFLASGGTVDEYRVRLEERQKMETAFREQAAVKLGEAARGGDEAALRRVWKEQNAWLQTMGIARLPLPERR